MKSPAILLRALFNDITVQDTHAKGLDRDYITVDARSRDEGTGFLSCTLPTLGKAFLKGLEDGEFLCPTAFKRKGALPLFLGGLLKEVFDSETGLILETPCIGCIKNLHLICSVFKKLRVDPRNKQKLTKEAQAKYAILEERVQEGFNPRKLDLLKRVAHLTLHTAETFNPSDVTGVHGPGAVYEKMSPNEKWRSLASSILLDRRLDEIGYTESFNAYLKPDLPIVETRGNMSRVIDVPKTSTSVRLITVEPFLNQFIQGGLRKYLWKLIPGTPLKNCVELDRQELNQKLALEGSLTRGWSTIDLSSASDLLSDELVFEIFGRYKEFYNLLVSCRTPYAEFGNTRFLHKKFAGMGNATTFPIQSIVYALLCVSAIFDQLGKQPSYRSVEALTSCIRVYGDDIIVRAEYTSVVLEWLSDFGFIVNAGKSFLKGSFRESCGVDAYAGVDVTPVYVKHWPSRTESSSEALSNVVAASNLLWSKCYYRAATVLQELVESCLKGQLPLVQRDAGALGWTTRQNAYTIEKWSKRYQRFEYRGWVVRSKDQSDPLDGYAALLKFFHLPCGPGNYVENIRGPRHLSRTSVRGKSILVRQWCPV